MLVNSVNRATCGLALVLVLASWGSAAASPITFDTSALAGGTFTLAFDLIDGDAGANTQVTIDAFNFGGGSVVGPPVYFDGASGDTTAGVVLIDTSFLNTFMQDFAAGSFLSFDIAFAGGGTATPDSFAFSILSGGVPIATTDPTGANLLFLAELGAAAPALAAFELVPVPEPATGALTAIGIAAACWRCRRRNSSK